MREKRWIALSVTVILAFTFLATTHLSCFGFCSAGLIPNALADENSASPSLAKTKVPYLLYDGGHDLCSAILRQAQVRMKRDGHICSVPYANAKDDIWLPDWKPVDPEAHLDLLAKIMSADPIGYATTIAGKMGTDFQDTKKKIEENGGMEVYLRPYVQDIAAAINAGRGSFETTLMDVANTGHKQRVYRLSVMRLRDKNDMTSWEAVTCGEGLPNSRPYSLIYVESDSGTSFLIYNRGSTKDLFQYKGRSYTAYRSMAGPSSVSSNRVSSPYGASNSSVYESYACRFFFK